MIRAFAIVAMLALLGGGLPADAMAASSAADLPEVDLFKVEGLYPGMAKGEALDRRFGIPTTHEKKTKDGVEFDVWEWLVPESGIRVRTVRKLVDRKGWKEAWWFVIEVFELRSRDESGREAVCRCEPEPVSSDCVETKPVLIKESLRSAKYPREARKKNASGKVHLSIVVERDGSVGRIIVHGAPDPDLGFSEAAIEAVQEQRYEPATCDGHAVASWYRTFQGFTLMEPAQGKQGKRKKK